LPVPARLRAQTSDERLLTARFKARSGVIMQFEFITQHSRCRAQKFLPRSVPMSFKSIAAVTVLGLMTSAALPPVLAHAGQSRTIVLTPKGRDAQAIREGLRIYSWANSARNTAIVDQRGRNNGAGVGQHGSGNFGAVVQRGHNNSATLAQNGNNNAMAIFQVGRGHSYDASQNGNGKTGIVVQVGR
jgi:Curlin associated repeat